MNQANTLVTSRLALSFTLGLSALFTAQTVEAQPRWGRPSMPRAGACFYRNVDFQGDYFCANAGEDLAVLSRGMNNQISSIRTFGNVDVSIFDTERFGGRSARYERDVRDLRAGGWNDRLSSIRVQSGYGDRRDDGRGPGDRGGRPDDRGGQVGDRNGRPDDRGGRDDGRGGSRSGPDYDSTVRRLYQEVLQREPDAPGLALYRGRMANEHWSEKDVRDALLKSPEYRDKNTMTPQKAQAVVAAAYRAVLNREPDPASSGYVDRVMREKWSQADVERELRKSPEYLSKHR